MNLAASFLLFLASASASVETPAPAPVAAGDGAVNAAIARANARIVAGESEAAVEAELIAELSAQGAEVEAEPPAWDAFGQARWKRMADKFAHSYERTPPPTKEATNDEATNVLRADAGATAEDNVIRGGTDGHAGEQRRPAVVHFSDSQRMDVESTTDVETGLLHVGNAQPQEGDSLLPES